MQLTLLVTSPRVAPGLMSWPAWSAVASATRRLASSAEGPLARAVAAAGHPVEILPVLSVGALLEAAAAGDVVWLADADEADRFPPLLRAALDTGPVGVSFEVLQASYDVPGARLLDLVTVMDRLRAECPWDREQTHTSLARYLLEETYETLEAIDSGDPVHLREELGDLLLQVYFHARVAAEAGEGQAFTIDDVAAGIVDKLVHRHPHVFAGLDVADADEVDRNWESLKAEEKGRASIIDGIPLALPALALADKVVGRAARVGVAAADAGAAAEPGARPEVVASEGIGARLLALVVEARAAGVDPEQALREVVRQLVVAVRAAEPA